MSRYTTMPPSGAYPEVTAFAKDWMSGWTFQCVSANHWPVRQKPVIKTLLDTPAARLNVPALSLKLIDTLRIYALGRGSSLC